MTAALLMLALARPLIIEADPRRQAAFVEVAGERRLAHPCPAVFDTTLPARALLTFGLGVSGSARPAVPWRLVLREGARVVAALPLPRDARRWQEHSVFLDGRPRRVRLAFEVEPNAPEVQIAIAQPTVHDLADYGRSKGILLVSIDTLRRDHVGVYGYRKPTTPTLDAIARTGIVCTDAVSTSSWTLPAHVSMLTSADPAAHGAVDRDHGYSGTPESLPTLLRRAGYATQAVTSHLYVSPAYGLDAGFDHMDFRQDRPAVEVADRAIALLDRLGDRPLFLFVHFYDPHWNYTPPPEVLRLFPAARGSGGITGWYRDFSRRTRAGTSPEDLERLLALYDGEIRYTDNQVGRILERVRDLGLVGSTLVLVTSDHGEEFLEHGSWEHQKTLYEEVVRVPLIVRGPRVVPRVEARPASLLDVAPTVLAWAGEPVPATMQGTSLLAPLPEREAYGETDHV
jgi:arylsulfatase A-like enzyme